MLILGNWIGVQVGDSTLGWGWHSGVCVWWGWTSIPEKGAVQFGVDGYW